jgi:hypothetical protein
MLYVSREIFFSGISSWTRLIGNQALCTPRVSKKPITDIAIHPLSLKSQYRKKERLATAKKGKAKQRKGESNDCSGLIL